MEKLSAVKTNKRILDEIKLEALETRGSKITPL